jgi:hypothetical protein
MEANRLVDVPILLEPTSDVASNPTDRLSDISRLLETRLIVLAERPDFLWRHLQMMSTRPSFPETGAFKLVFVTDLLYNQGISRTAT